MGQVCGAQNHPRHCHRFISIHLIVRRLAWFWNPVKGTVWMVVRHGRTPVNVIGICPTEGGHPKVTPQGGCLHYLCVFPKGSSVQWRLTKRITLSYHEASSLRQRPNDLLRLTLQTMPHRRLHLAHLRYLLLLACGSCPL